LDWFPYRWHAASLFAALAAVVIAIVATDLWDALFFGGMGLACAWFPSKLPEVFERAPWRQSRGLVVGMGYASFATNVLLSLLILCHGAG
jgi:hypothetical protein